MAKINHIQIGDKIRYIENISYKNSLPTATSDSADFVSVNNTLYAKQSFNGEYRYSQVGSGSGSGVEIVDIAVTELEEETGGMFAMAELDQATYLKINGDSFVIIRLLVPVEEETQIAYFLTPAMGTPPILSDDESPVKIYSCSFAGTMNAILMPLTQESDDGTISYFAYFIAEEITEVVANSSDSTTATLTKLKVDGVNYAVPGVTEEELDTKQDVLVSGTNIKTINNESILGSGNIEVGGITIVDTLPTANSENYLKGKIYTQGDLLKYISKVALSEPNISTIGSLVNYTNKAPAAIVGTNIYLFGGECNQNGSLREDFIQKLSTTTNELTTLSTTLPTSAYSIAAAAVGTNIYLFGGTTGTTVNATGTTRLKTINQFSTTTNELTTLNTEFPEPITSLAAAVVGTDIYIFGGSSESYLNTIWKFSTTTNELTTLSTTLPIAASSIAAVTVGTDIYLFGGGCSTSNGGYLNTIQKFSTITNELTTLSTTLPTATCCIAAAVVGTNIYLLGGYNDNVLNTINKFDTITETITTLSTTLPTSAYYMGVTSAGTDIYLFGGKSSSSVLNTINKVEFGEYSYKTLPTLDTITNVIETEY